MSKIDEIKALLDELEAENASVDDQVFAENFEFLELPEIVCSIIDYLQPALYPYEAAVYWHLFRKSVLGEGTQYTRASVRGHDFGGYNIFKRSI